MPYDAQGSPLYDLNQFRPEHHPSVAGPSTSTYSAPAPQNGYDWSLASYPDSWQQPGSLMPAQPTSPAPRPCGCNDCQPQASEALSNPLQPQASGLPAPVSAFHGGGFASFPQSQQPQQQQQQHQLQPASRPVPNIMSEPQRYDPFKLPLPSSILQSQTNGSAPGDSTGSLPTYSSTPATLYQPASTSSSAVPAQLSFDLSSFGFHAPPSLADPGALRRSPYEAKPLGPNIPMSEPPVGSRSISPRRRTRPGDTSSSSSNGSPPRTDGGGDDRVDSPTPFINKLHFLLSNPQYDCIRWGSDGQSLIFAANSPDLVAAFSQVFRHRNINSFVRQLNIYNFKRLSGVELHDALLGTPPTSIPQADWTGFRHEAFYRDTPGRTCELGRIKPTKGKHYSATRRASTGSATSGAAGGVMRQPDMRGKGKVGDGAIGPDRKYST
ncbi:hypothetical protein JCM8202_000929 [Rhodotorula sphaerocarpa]